MKKQLLTIALTTLCLTKLFAQTYTEVEPNNSFALANEVSVPVIITDSMESATDTDFFKISLISSGVVTVTISNNDNFIILNAYNSSQGLIAVKTPSVMGSGFTYDLLLPAGDSYLAINDINNGISSANFSIKLSFDNSDVCEPNNDFATACIITLGSTIHPQIFGANSDLGGNDADFFKMNLPSAGVISLSLSNLAANQSIKLVAYNSSELQIASKQSSTNGSGFKYDLLLPSGISYLKISDTNNNSDTIHLNFTVTFDQSDACEINNDFATACSIPPSTTTHFQLFGNNSDLGGNDADFFKLNLPKSGVVSLSLSNLGSNQLVKLVAYNSSQSQIAFKQSSSNGIGFNYDLLLPTGVSYLKVFDTNGISDSTHLHFTLAYDTSDANEINNSFVTASLVKTVDTLYPQIFGFNSGLGGNDTDYYKLQITECINECLTISNVQPSQLLKLSVYDSLFSPVGSAQSPTNGAGFKYCFDLGKGKYYFRLSDVNETSSSGHIKVVLANTPVVLSAPIITSPGSSKFCLIDSIVLSSNSQFNHWSNGDTSKNIVVHSIGVYSDTIINLLGCRSATASVTVIKGVKPTVTVSNNTLSSSEATSYQWYLEGYVINGQTSKSYTPSWNGHYSVKITDNNGCSVTSAPFKILGLGTNEINGDNLISIFPNPTNRRFTVTFPENAKQIVISNSIGQVIQTNLLDGQRNLNFELSVEGIYFIQIKTDKQIVTRRLSVYH